MPVGLVEEFRFTGERAVEVRGRFSDPEILATDSRLSKVLLRGSVAYEEAEAQKPGENRVRSSIVWTSVNRDDVQRRKALASPLESSLNADTNILPAVPVGQEITARGDVEGAVVAAKSLFEEGFTAAATDEELPEKEGPLEAGSSEQAGGGGSGSADNGYFDDWTPPDEEPVAETSPVEAPPEYGQTAEGCPIRVDLDQNVAIQQTRMTENDKPLGDCTDGNDRYQIRRNYSECDHLIDMTEMMAFEQFSLYYQPPGGSPVNVSACTPDEDRGMVIETTDSGCEASISPARDRYIINERTIYRNRNGKVHVIDECGPGDTELPIERNYSACSDQIDMDSRSAHPRYEEVVVRPDGTAKLSQCQPADDISWPIIDDPESCEVVVRTSDGEAVQQVRTVYKNSLTGQTVELLRCHDGSESFDLVRDYDACTVSLDLGSMTATPQYELIYVNQNGDRKRLSDCQVDRNLSTAIISDTKTCGILRDPATNEMVQHARLVYENRLGGEVVVKDCQPTNKRFAIEKTYRQCDDTIDFAREEAYPNFREYWTDQGGTTKYLGECQEDTENPYILETTTLGCPMEPSVDGSELIQKDRVIYTSRSGKTNVVRECEESGRSFSVQKDYDVCPYKLDLDKEYAKAQYKQFWIDDFGQRHLISGCLPDDRTLMFEETSIGCSDDVRLYQGKVIRNTRIVFRELNGLEQEVRGCAPSDTEFKIERSYSGCSDQIDLARNVAYPRYSQAWTDDDGTVNVVSECTVDEESPMPLVVDSDSCGLRENNSSNEMVQYARLIYIGRSGAAIPVTECKATDERYPIERSYSVCDDEVLLDENRAYARYRRFYLENGENRFLDTSCVRDPNSAFNIVRDYESCSPIVDLGSEQVTLQARKTYIGLNSNVNEVQSCLPVEGDILPIEWTKDGCSIRSDVAEGRSYVQERPFYTWRGQRYDAGQCIDRETSYVHERFYGECPNLIRADKAVPQYMLGYRDESGLSRYLTGCTPDEDRAFAITKKICQGDYIHDVSAGQTFGKSSLFYLDEFTGEEKVLSYCSKDMSISYPHQVQGVGWQSFDAERLDRQRERIYVNLPTGQVEISSGAVRPGAAELPYQYVRSDSRGIGNIYYEGCTKYQATEEIKIWKRNDGTHYEQVVGSGPVQSLGNACTQQVPTSSSAWTHVATLRMEETNCTREETYITDNESWHTRCVDSTAIRVDKYRAVRKTVREDGTVVSETPAEKLESRIYGGGWRTPGTHSGNYSLATAHGLSCNNAGGHLGWYAYSRARYGNIGQLTDLCTNKKPAVSTVDLWLDELGWR